MLKALNNEHYSVLNKPCSNVMQSTGLPDFVTVVLENSKKNQKQSQNININLELDLVSIAPKSDFQVSDIIEQD